MLQRPELGRERARRRLHQRRQIDVIGAERTPCLRSEAAAPGRAASGRRRPRAVEDAERLDELKGDALASPEVLRLLEREQRPEQPLDMVADPDVEARLHSLARRRRSTARRRATRRRGASTLSAAASLATGSPIQRTVPSMPARTRCRAPGRISARAPRSRRRAPWRRRRAEPCRFAVAGGRIGRELEALQRSDVLAFDDHVAGLGDFGLEHGVFSQAPHQNAGATVDEALGEAFVQRVGELVLDASRDPCQ